MVRSSPGLRPVVESHCRPVYPGRHRPPRSAVSRIRCPGRPPPPGTGSAARPSAVTESDAGTPSWVCPPSTGTAYAWLAWRSPARTRAANEESRAPTASSSATGTAPIAARSLTLTRTEHQPAQSGSRSTIDGIIASHAATRSLPGTGTPSSPMNPGTPAISAISGPSSGPRVLLVACARAAIRPTGHRISVWSRPATVTARAVCQPSRANIGCALTCTVASNRSTPAFSA